jgi:hypothetical protein
MFLEPQAVARGRETYFDLGADGYPFDKRPENLSEEVVPFVSAVVAHALTEKAARYAYPQGAGRAPGRVVFHPVNDKSPVFVPKLLPMACYTAVGLAALTIAEYMPSATGCVGVMEMFSNPASCRVASYSEKDKAPAMQPT